MKTKAFLVATSFLVSVAAAFADGAPQSAGTNAIPLTQGGEAWFVGYAAAYNWVDAPEHANGIVQLDLGHGTRPEIIQADVTGWSYGLAVGHDFDSGWRLALSGRYLDADGSATKRFVIPDGTPYQIGQLDGTLDSAGGYGGPGAARQQLSVDETEWSVMLAAGHVLLGEGASVLRGDVSISYDEDFTADHDTLTDTNFGQFYINNTYFDTQAIELAARLAGTLPLAPQWWLAASGSAGAAFKNIDMHVHARRNVVGNLTEDRFVSDDDTGFVGRAELSINYAVSDRTSIALYGGATYDAIVPVYRAPDYNTGTPAGFDTEGHTDIFAGLRLFSRW